MNRALRVAIVTQFPIDPDKPVGGVEAVSVNLVRELAADPGLDVHVATLVDTVPESPTCGWMGSTLHYLARPPGSMLRLAIDRGRRVIMDWLRGHPVDLVHAHDTYGLMVKGYPGPRVFTVHGFIHGDTRVSGSRFAGLRAGLWKYVETRGWADQPNIISISPYVRECVSRFSAARIRDIDNPVASRFFATRWQPEPCTVFSAAEISPRKNTLRLIEACLLLRDRGLPVRLRLAGPVVDADYGARIRDFLAANKLTDVVHLLGSLSSTDVQAELARASLFALVSLEENSPMGIEEAMAVGMPVISSNRCGMPYMIRHGQSGFLVDPHDPLDIADALQRTLESPEQLARMGRSGRGIAEERFHPTAVAAQTAAFYHEIV